MGFRNRLALFLVVALIAVQGLTVFAAYGVVRQNLVEQGRQGLKTAADVFMRQLTMLSERVSDGVQVLALDYPLRQAIAEHDRDTVLSALRNHGNRVGATRMSLIALEGEITADTALDGAVGKPFPLPKLLSTAADTGRSTSLAVLDGQVYWVVVVPVKAPVPIAFIAAGVPIDDALLNTIRQLSALQSTIALATQNQGIFSVVAKTDGHPAATQLSLPSGRAVKTTSNGAEHLTLATPLETGEGSEPVVAILDYPLDEALRQYEDVIPPVLWVLLAALSIAVIGAVLIAGGVSKPIETLAATARRIEKGDYTAPPRIAQRDEIGQLSAAIAGMAQSIKDRQQALEEAFSSIAFARDEAVRANEAKSQFLANMSHELRTPLNAIIGFGDMIRGEMLGAVGNKRYLEYARDIYDSGMHLLSLVEEILDLAKVEAGTLQLSRTPTNVGNILTGILQMLRPTAERAGVDIEVKSDPAKWAEIDCDALKIKQVLINILGNAIKFTPAGGKVSIDGEAFSGRLRLRIRDTGIGMRPEDIPMVCEPFYRVNSALDGKYQGAGLGLPIAKSIVELHGGTLEIDSEYGRGTTVVIVLPISVAVETPLNVNAA
jgi:signal transduction histidine kinase